MTGAAQPTPSTPCFGRRQDAFVGFRCQPGLVEAIDEECRRSFRPRSFVIRKLLCVSLGVPFVECGIQLDVVPSDRQGAGQP